MEENVLFLNKFNIRDVYDFTKEIIRGNLSIRLVDATMIQVRGELANNNINYKYDSNKMKLKFKLNDIKIDVEYDNRK